MLTLTSVLAIASALTPPQAPAGVASGTPATTSPWVAQASPVEVELRGLSVVSDRVAWASGAKGTILRTVDGEAWRVVPVPGAEALDFRDIQAFDENTAIALTIGPGASSNVFKTVDGGLTWRKVFTNPEPDGFWDAIAFSDAQHGVLFGDPVRGRFQVFTTEDGGETWRAVAEADMPAALENEGAFAASGQCLVTGPSNRVAFVTGGAAQSRVFVSTNGGRRFTVAASPVPTGAPSRGLFAAAWLDATQLVVVGGDYRDRTLAGVNAARSADGGATWAALEAQPVGFLSSIVHGRGADGGLVAVGLAGTGVSADGGRTWRALDTTPYNTAAFAKTTGWAVGPKGVIARWRR